jgi:hypothetical protein
MSNNDQPNLREPSVTPAAVGSMTGTIKFLHNQTAFLFNTNRVFRGVSSGETHLYAEHILPGADRAYRIFLYVPGNEPTSTTYTIGSTNVRAFVDIVDHAHLTAESGEIVIQNHTPIRRLTGSTKYKTAPYENMQYEVEVVFDISDSVTGS